jgi:hypothetical protein
MGWPVILTPQSQDDLREIVSFVARDSPNRARRFGHLLLDTEQISQKCNRVGWASRPPVAASRSDSLLHRVGDPKCVPARWGHLRAGRPLTLPETEGYTFA